MSDSTAAYGAQPAETATFATVTGGLIGNMVEWYDWTIYGLLSSVFASQFFPSGNAMTALLATLATFALGFVMRSDPSCCRRWPTNMAGGACWH